jgi:hypothetical protein
VVEPAVRREMVRHLQGAYAVGERRGRLSETDPALFLGSAARFPVGFYREPDEATVLAPVLQHRFTVHDASCPERISKATPRKISASSTTVVGVSSAGRTMASAGGNTARRPGGQAENLWREA